jgi:hypothetical protein
MYMVGVRSGHPLNQTITAPSYKAETSTAFVAAYIASSRAVEELATSGRYAAYCEAVGLAERAGVVAGREDVQREVVDFVTSRHVFVVGGLISHNCDYVINQLLTDEKIGRFIEGGCLNKSLYDAGKGTAEGIYALLPEGDGNAPGGTGSDLEQPSGSPAEQAQQQAEWRIKTAQAAQAAKMMGKLSANMERFVTELLYPKVDWRDVLRQFVTKAATDERSWARPNRRFASQGYYAPGRSGEVMGPMVVAVDCSGSVDERQLNEFASEVRAIHEDTKPAALHVVYFDSKVCHQDSFGPDDAVTLAPHGGGGTAFSPVIRHIDEQGLEPVACVFLTDLYCSDFGPVPEFPVLWVSNGSKKAPWGEVVAL